MVSFDWKWNSHHDGSGLADQFWKIESTLIVTTVNVQLTWETQTKTTVSVLWRGINVRFWACNRSKEDGQWLIRTRTLILLTVAVPSTPMKTSLKNRLCVLWNFSALIPSHPFTWKLKLKKGDSVRVQRERESKIYRLAVPVLKSTQNLVSWGCSCAGTAKKCTKKRDARAQLLSCSLNVLLFWRYRCCHRRSFVRSLIRQLKQQRQRWEEKLLSISEFELLQTLSRLSHLCEMMRNVLGVEF